MFDTAGSRLNFSVLAGAQDAFLVSFWVGSEGMSVTGATFQAACYALHGGVPGELVAELPVEHDAAVNKVRLIVPELEEGHYAWELRATDPVGGVSRLLYGTLTALSSAEVATLAADADGSSLRELSMQVAGDAAAPMILRWQACGLAANLVSDAARYAEEAKAAVGRLEGVEAAVQEFRVFMSAWKDDAASVLVMNPVTGTIWVGNTDTGQPYRGEDGKAPRVNAYGYWETFDGERWNTLPYKAIGRDGVDGDQVRRELIDSVGELPAGEERGVLYYVQRVASRASAIFYISTSVGPDFGLYINGVHVYEELEEERWDYTEQELVNKINSMAELPVRAYLRNNRGVVIEAKEIGKAGNAITLDLGLVTTGPCAGLVNPHGLGIPATLSGGADGDGGYDLWAWVDPVGWLCVGSDAYGVATEESLGLMCLGTGQPVADGAPVGLNEHKQAMVPLASTTVPGAMRPSSDVVSDVGGGTHFSVSGNLLCDVATVGSFGGVKLSTGTVLTAGGIIGVNADGQLLVRLATPEHAGAVLPGSKYAQLESIPYLLSVGVDGRGRLANCMVRGGALQHKQPKDWAGGWIESGAFPVDGAHYLGLVTSVQFTQSRDAGLELLPATTQRLAGVYLAESGADERPAAVLPARLSLSRAEGYTKAEIDKLFVSKAWHGGVREVYLSLSEYQALPKREPDVAYNILED